MGWAWDRGQGSGHPPNQLRLLHRHPRKVALPSLPTPPQPRTLGRNKRKTAQQETPSDLCWTSHGGRVDSPPYQLKVWCQHATPVLCLPLHLAQGPPGESQPQVPRDLPHSTSFSEPHNPVISRVSKAGLERSILQTFPSGSPAKPCPLSLL